MYRPSARILVVLSIGCAGDRVQSEIGAAPSFAHVELTPLPAFAVDTTELDAWLAEASTAAARWHAEKRPGLPPEIGEPTRVLASIFAEPTLPRFERAGCGPNAIPIAGGWVASLRFGDRWTTATGFVRRDADGIRIYELPPAELTARTRLTHGAGTAWVSDNNGRSRLELRLTIESDDRFARLVAPILGYRAEGCDDRAGAAIVALAVEGGGRWTSFGGELFVETRAPGVATTVTMTLGEISNRWSILQGGWLPVPAAAAPYDLDLVLAVNGGGLLYAPASIPARAPVGWRAVRLRGSHATPMLVLTSDRAQQASIDVRGASIQLVGTLATCPDRIAALMRRLPDLAALSALTLVEAHYVPNGTASYGGGVIAVAPAFGTAICVGDPAANALLLHELAHAWCP